MLQFKFIEKFYNEKGLVFHEEGEIAKQKAKKKRHKTNNYVSKETR